MIILFVLSVDCRWGAWGTWTECTKTCGGGTRQGVRKIEREAKNGGVPCTGSTKRTVACNTQSCPGNKWAHLYNFLNAYRKISSLVIGDIFISKLYHIVETGKTIVEGNCQL